MKNDAIYSRQENVCGTNKDEADKIISARWEFKKLIIAVLGVHALVFDLAAGYAILTPGAWQKYSILLFAIGFMQTIAVLKLSFEFRDDVLTKEEREYYNSLG
ncbi:TPA: hypothetical protein RQN23_003005 [Aeromonas veronii]|nr:hypothetical protein [Aeromonas veronii]